MAASRIKGVLAGVASKAKGALRATATGKRKGRNMAGLIWGGAALSAVGLGGLIWCIIRVWKARRAGLADEELRDVVRKVVPLNMGALMLSVLGLMMVILGIFLA